MVLNGFWFKHFFCDVWLRVEIFKPNRTSCLVDVKSIYPNVSQTFWGLSSNRYNINNNNNYVRSIAKLFGKVCVCAYALIGTMTYAFVPIPMYVLFHQIHLSTTTSTMATTPTPTIMCLQANTLDELILKVSSHMVYWSYLLLQISHTV